MRASNWSAGTVALAALLIAAPGTLEAQDWRDDGDWWRWAVAELLLGEDVFTTQGQWVRIGPRGHYDQGRFGSRGRYDRNRFGSRDRHRRDRFNLRDRYPQDRIGPFGRGRDFDRRDWRGRDARGPAFCRSGAGHPVFGRRWCVEKGFGLGHARWRRGDLGDIIFRRYPRRHGSILDRPGLEEILGDIILGRLLESAGVRHRRAPVTGRWLQLEDSGARVLQLRSGSLPLAELSDLDLDGRVDVLLWSELER